MRQFYTIVFITLDFIFCFSQNIDSISIDSIGNIAKIHSSRLELEPTHPTSLLSFDMDGRRYELSDGLPEEGMWLFEDRVSVQIQHNPETSEACTAAVHFTNHSGDTIGLENIVIFGANPDRYYITGYGKHRLSRTRIFRPGQSPVPVILPDNAWELSYSDLPLNHSNISATGLSRRIGWENARRTRFETYLYPGGSVTYRLYAECYEGEWQEGLRVLFQQRWLYDLPEFDNQLFQRKDLAWIRDQYVIHLMMAWDHHFTQIEGENFRLQDFVERGNMLYGGDDVIGLWPTWPALGLDQRNQWDLFRDLPDRLTGIRAMMDSLHSRDIRFFICYNPWDESTRFEGHLQGMANILAQTQADGVVLDTRGSSSTALQTSADSVKSGVVMYSEGMAIPKDMAGILAGRVHNALYYPPVLNLNKLIKPDFAIFRVAELSRERIRREYNISMFNGHGVEINMFRPGQPEWIEEDYRYLGKVARILRENSSNFRSYAYTPLLPSLLDSLYINYWPGTHKDVYTFYSLHPEGIDEPVSVVTANPDRHFVDIWNHTELELPGDTLSLRMDSFHKSDMGTNNEGAVAAVAAFEKRLLVHLDLPFLHIDAGTGTGIKIWKGNPEYAKNPINILPG